MARGKGKRGRAPAATKQSAAAAKRKKTAEPAAATEKLVDPTPEETLASMERQPILFDVGVAQLQVGMNKLLEYLEGEDVQFSADEFMDLYTICYNMCVQKPPYEYSGMLYDRYKEVFVTYITTKVLPALQAHRDEFLLQGFLKRWDNHQVMIRWMVRFFNYLDRYHVNRHSKPSLKDTGLLCFRDEVYGPIKDRAREAVLQLIEREREGYAIDKPLVKNVLNIFIEVGMNNMDKYTEDFQTELFKETADYYKRKASTWIQEDSCPEFLVKAEEALAQEEQRLNNYLHADSREGLLRQVETECLANYETQLLEKENSGVAALLRDKKKDDLARIYRLFSRITKGLDPVAEAFKRHVEGEGLALVKEVTEAINQKKEAGKASKESAAAASEQHYVSSLIAIHDNYADYVATCFGNSSMFHKALKDAFEGFCNKDVAGNSSAEMMATFCNNLLRKGGIEKMSEDEVDIQLEKVVKLLAYISDKDLFSEFYRKKLGRRLLNDSSTHDEAERSILSKLKQQCGTQFTCKMEGMVNDLQLAKEKHTRFDEWKRTNQRELPCDLHVNVLTIGFWPPYKAIDLALPQEMVSCVNLFKEHYEETAKHRNLTWIHTLGTVTLKSQFKNRIVELSMTPIQAVVLMLFETQDSLSFEEVKEQSSMNEEDLMRSLHSLSCAKYKLLIKSPVGNRIAKTDSFKLNHNFSDKARRIKVPLPPQDERKKVQEDVNSDRKYAIDAAIVRTMKSRKQLAHQKLIVEVVAQLSRMFNPDLRLIKRRIEELIQREFLARDPENQNLYKYLA